MVECKCDNEVVVMVIKHGYTKEKHMARLLRCLLFIEAKFNVTLVATHVPGAENLVADALSRNRLMEFFILIPQARPRPSQVPPALLQGLASQQDWTLVNWTSWFTSISSAH